MGQLLDDLDLPVELTAKFEGEDNVDGHAVDWLMAGDLVAIAVASIKHSKTKHWTLCRRYGAVLTINSY